MITNFKSYILGQKAELLSTGSDFEVTGRDRAGLILGDIVGLR
jgi:hypothetical protein